MTTRSLALAVLALTTLTGTVMADDRINLTPPLYREQARSTAAVRPASELNTTPSLTARTLQVRRVVADADANSSR
jgi:hypothetical protein